MPGTLGSTKIPTYREQQLQQPKTSNQYSQQAKGMDPLMEQQVSQFVPLH